MRVLECSLFSGPPLKCLVRVIGGILNLVGPLQSSVCLRYKAMQTRGWSKMVTIDIMLSRMLFYNFDLKHSVSIRVFFHTLLEKKSHLRNEFLNGQFIGK